MRSRRNSIEDTLLQLLLQPKYRYHGMPVSALGIPALFPYKQYKKQTIANTLSVLKKKDFISREGSDRIMVRPKGQAYLAQRADRLQMFASESKDRTARNLLVLFDIPEDRKAEREWFRMHLRNFGYEMIQKSVWLGPAPLPKPFLEYVKSIGLSSCVKVFKVNGARGNHI